MCWLPEGNGAALYEGQALLAIIPPWSGQGGFHGYARDCVGEGSVAWALPTDPTLARRFEAAAAFWQAWNDDPWPEIQESSIRSIERVLGPHSNYYAIDGGGWPPRALLRIVVHPDYRGGTGLRHGSWVERAGRHPAAGAMEGSVRYQGRRATRFTDRLKESDVQEVKVD